ncbi:hypothetical protein [Kutzneria kofuensis]|uniref:Uncharacterized protein n=1 Tax=Kutzneria kofuensis TaxID=103725 RepID=A0A7W9KFH3_9PSEU|nr:hypothetical protein [Kutzneria kofuensis]MBB5891628.1 hypothetical protein [Kutzneria kofuensis]
MFTTKIRAAATMALAATAALAVAGFAQAAPLQPHAADPNDVQVVTTDGNSSLVHTIRHGDGTWQSFGRIGNYDGVSGLTSTLVNGEENIFFQHSTAKGKMLAHLVRHADGTWNMDASTPALPAGTTVDNLAVTTVSNQINLVRRSGNDVQLSTLGADGVWSAWSAVPTDGRALRGLSAAASQENDYLNVVELTADGKTVVEYVRNGDGTWTAGNATPSDPNGYGVATEVSAAMVGQDLQVAAVEIDRTFPEVFHTVLHHNTNAWDPFRQLVGAVGVSYGSPAHVAITNAPNAFLPTLQLVYTTSDGDMYHTIRDYNGNWQPLGNVENAAGNVTAGQVSIAGQNF